MRAHCWQKPVVSCFYKAEFNLYRAGIAALAAATCKASSIPKTALASRFPLRAFVKFTLPALVGFGACSTASDLVEVKGPGSLKLGAVGPCGDSRILAELQRDLQCPWIDSCSEKDIARAMVNKACGTFALNAASLFWGETLGALTGRRESLSMMRDMATYAAETYRPLGFNSDIDFEDLFPRSGPAHAVTSYGDPGGQPGNLHDHDHPYTDRPPYHWKKYPAFGKIFRNSVIYAAGI